MNKDVAMLQKNTLSEFAIAKRENTGETVREFAKSHGSSKSQINKYETGYYDTRVTPSIAKSFCKIYGVSYDKFIADFDYNDNHKVIISLGTKEQIETRLANELPDSFSGEVCINFYNQYKNTFDLKNKNEIDYMHLKDVSFKGIFVERQLECVNSNNEKVIISYFLRPFLFPNKPRSISYKYIGKAISDVSCYDSSEIYDCKNFIFITPSMDVFNFYSSKKYNKSSNNLYIVHVKGNNIFSKPQLLFGKKFIG